MMRQNRQRRTGFTMIELLVVMGIIAILVGLLVSAVMKVASTSPRTETMARMKGIDAAIGTFKSDRFSGKGYIPAGQHDLTTGTGPVIGPFRLRNSYTSATSPRIDELEAQYLIQAFSLRVDANGNLPNLGNPLMNANLDANQTLLFFLGGVPSWDGQGNVGFDGFSNDPTKPFTPATQGEIRKGPYLDINRKMYSLDTPTSFPRLIDGYKIPLAYFTAFNNKSGTTTGTLTNLYANGQAQPYMSGGKFINQSGWQIVSAGEDKVFTTATTPVDWANVDLASNDNLANFSTKLLGGGPTGK
jgi:prepilin-type N-terminal cleavage/methylation domain-containing protein